MTRKQQLAALAVRAGQDMVRLGAEHGIGSDVARQAAQLADRAAAAAEAAGCTAADYDHARRTH
ncbi:hypothetical protein [Streptomyces roseolilacinus]|uniref:Uncharacterized protein n=1 Tax=Streptomyces roseolilacinus TaxID=66904 RepID=A0A918B4I0_9ACTN|nr:hypothetical protein [Streptomyces roseolilacinus]GGQ12337.1 hypothetical protein GCM10010249_33730 [Streptomyces roseolilacinus]